MEDPELWRTLWLRRLDDYSTGIETRVATLRQESESPALLPRTRNRLLAIAGAFEQQLEVVAALFEALDAGADDVVAAAIPSQPEPGAQAAVLESYEHIFRDWVWGDEEHALALGLVKPLMPPEGSRVAVYGDGAGRTALDLHQSCGPAETYALAQTPLPFLVTSALLSGVSLRLPEFPVDPVSDEVAVVPHELKAPHVARDGFSLLFADPLRPPFRPGSLDAVVTSWFIDAARTDVRETAAVINRLLRPGGLWINLGPLRFQTVVSRAYTIEEVTDLVGAAAFEVITRDRHAMPHFRSPASGSHRTETIFRFSARKVGEAAAVQIPETLPPWVMNPLMPIPITQTLVSIGRTSMFTTGVLSMIDGHRSIVDVARELGAAWGVEPGRLQDELRAFLAKIPQV